MNPDNNQDAPFNQNVRNLGFAHIRRAPRRAPLDDFGNPLVYRPDGNRRMPRTRAPIYDEMDQVLTRSLDPFDNPFLNPFAGFANNNTPRYHPRFSFKLKIYSFDLLDPEKKERLNRSNKIILPESVLINMTHRQVSPPYFFKLENKRLDISTCASVEEFTAPDGYVYAPQTMINNLLLGMGDELDLVYQILPKGSYVQFKSLSEGFDTIPEQKEMLEQMLGNFQVLNLGDIIDCCDGEYRVKITKLKPERSVNTIDIDLPIDILPSDTTIARIEQERKKREEKKREEEEEEKEKEKEEEEKRVKAAEEKKKEEQHGKNIKTTGFKIGFGGSKNLMFLPNSQNNKPQTKFPGQGQILGKPNNEKV